MKFCSKCNTTKSLEDFYRKGSYTQPYCKTCFNSYCTDRWRKKKSEAVAYFGSKCLDCGGQFPDAVYDFHHLDPGTKDVNWDKLRLRSPDKIKEELDKCVMLCSNCHRIRHSEEFTLSN